MTSTQAATMQHLDPSSIESDTQENPLNAALTAEQEGPRLEQTKHEHHLEVATTNLQIAAEPTLSLSAASAQQSHNHLESALLPGEQELVAPVPCYGAPSMDKQDSAPPTKEESPLLTVAQSAQLDPFSTAADALGPLLQDPYSQVVAAAHFSPPDGNQSAVLQSDLNGNLSWGPPFAEEMAIPSQQGPARISAYAKLEFPDGEFYMNTYSIILGRDLQAARAAMREAAQQGSAEEDLMQAPLTPARIKSEDNWYKKSVASETGGILLGGSKTEAEGQDRRRRSRKASKKSKSTGSSSHHPSRRNSLVQPNGTVTAQPASQAKLIGSVTAGAAPVDPASLRPSPHDCPIVGIHPPASSDISGYKTISRRHVKISYNSKKRLFEAHIIGRNGAFIDEEFRPHQDVIPLKSGSRLQIGGVVVTFVLPDVAIGQTGAEEMYDDTESAARYREGGKEMSFDFEDGPQQGVLDGTSDEQSEDQELEGASSDDGEDDGDDAEDEDELESVNSETRRPYEEDRDIEMHDEDPEEQQRELERQIALKLISQKKRGPGRPPKNGLMSKREQQQVKKEAALQAQAQAQAKAKAHAGARAQAPAQAQVQQQAKSSENQAPTTKKKVGRPRKHPLPDPAATAPKRKYTKRKPKDPDAIQEGGDGSGSREKKPKKTPRPPKSPEPELVLEDFTAEQLEKPKLNYVIILHDILTNSPNGAPMSLSKIYRAMMLKYPYFHFVSTTTGWQSSVRHNLSQHPAFSKISVEGKGMQWSLVPGVPIEKDKKRKASPPPDSMHGQPHHQTIYQAPSYSPGMMPPPGFMAPHMHPQYPPRQSPYLPAQQIGFLQHQPGSHPQNGYPPQFVPPMHTPLLAQPGTVAYSSPYAPKPSPQQQAPQNNGNQPSPAQHIPSPVSNHAPAPAPASAAQRPPRTPPINQQSPPTPSAPQPEPPAYVKNLCAVFKDAMLKTMTIANAEEIIDCAVNRVLGIATPSNPNLQTSEVASKIDQLMGPLRNMLDAVRGAPPPPQWAQSQPASESPAPPQQQKAPGVSPTPNSSHDAPQLSSSTTPQQPHPHPHPQPQSSQLQSQPPNPRLTGSSFEPPRAQPPPSIPRPSFSSQSKNRANAPSIPRPAMNSSARRTSSPAAKLNASTAAANLVAANTGTSGGAAAPAVGQKRPMEDGNDMREAKKFSGVSVPQVKA